MAEGKDIFKWNTQELENNFLVRKIPPPVGADQ